MTFDNLLDHHLATALAWALVHFLWQGTLVALTLAIALRALTDRSASLRYALACIALLLMPAIPLSRFIPEISRPALSSIPNPGSFILERSSVSALNRSIAVGIRESDAGATRNIEQTPRASFGRFLPWMLLLWATGVLLLSMRLIGGSLYIRRLRTRFASNVAPEWNDRLWHIATQMRISRPVRLLESALVSVPTAIGWLRPVILLPASAISGLSINQLEAILAHELAHIRRHDYLVNVLQCVVETLLFYHPAVWWVSRRIREEREACCDDLAVNLCPDAIVYARALLEMEQLRVAGPRLAMAANGGLLMNRIQRLTKPVRPQADRLAGVLAGVMTIALIVTAGVAAQIGTPSTVIEISLPPSSPVADPVESLDSSINTRLNRSAQVQRSDRTQANPNPNPDAHAVPIPGPGPNPDPDSQPADKHSAEVEPGSTIRFETPQSLDSGNPVERATAACALGNAGAVESIPRLIDLLADDTTIEPIKCRLNVNWSPAIDTFRKASPGEEAAVALASFGEASLQPLIAALDRPNPVTRSNAAWAIGEMRGGLSVNREAAIEPLIVALKDAHPWVRTAAAFALGEMRPRSATDALIAALSDGDEKVRVMAASALGEMKSRRAVGQLSESLLHDQNHTVRRKAAWSLGEIQDRAALEALNSALKDMEPSVRSSAKRAISELQK